MTSFIRTPDGRNHTFYTKYAFRGVRECGKLPSKNHNFANFDYIYGTLSNHDGENRWISRRSRPLDGFTGVACNAEDDRPSTSTNRACV